MDNWQLDGRGYFILKEQTDDDFDVIFGRNDAKLQVEKGFFKSKEITPCFSDNTIVKVTTYQTGNDGFDIFKFMATNSSVEWSRLEFEDSKTVIGTSNLENKDGTLGLYLSKYSNLLSGIKVFDHCHPSSMSGPSASDIVAAKNLEMLSENVVCRVFYSLDFNNSCVIYDQYYDTQNYTFPDIIVKPK